MYRSLKALAALPLFLSLVPACASTGTDDELAGESSTDDAVDGKADGAGDGAYTYFEVWADLRKCASPMCGGFFFSRVNRTTTVCADGTAKASCYSPSIDWSESGLSDGLQGKLVEAANQDAMSAGALALVRGRFAPQTYPGHGNMGRFVVTEAWVAEGDAVSEGVFVKVRDAGVRCITTPCPSLLERGLNESRTAMLADIDWSPAHLTDKQIEGFTTQIWADPHGVIVAGDRYTVTENGHHAKGRTATAAYHRLFDVAPCYVGGCSSQVCSDIEGVITTCEAKAEYACYHTATCERQGDNSCGWTETPELDACLASH